MAEDGLFFSIFARVNPVTKVPVIAILVFGILMATMALIFDLEALVQFLSIGTLLAYTFVAASVIVLRFQPDKTSCKGSTSTSPNPNAEPSPAPSESQTITEDSGELKQYESFSDKLQLVERQKTRERRGVGQLRAYWEPYLGRLLGDCEPGEVVAFSVLTLIVSSVSLCVVLEFGSKQLQLPVWSVTVLLVIFILAYVLSLALIWIHEPQTVSKTFQVRSLLLFTLLLCNMMMEYCLSLVVWSWIQLFEAKCYCNENCIIYNWGMTEVLLLYRYLWFH